MEYLTDTALFVRQPNEPIAPNQIHDFLFVSTASTAQLIDLTHSVITSAVLLPPDTLRVWELRLTLLLFEGNLPVAKREAINLNRLIYLHENPDAKVNVAQNAKPVGGNDQQPQAGRTNAPQQIYPLPRNNENGVPYLLLLLLLRLKSTPSMGMVNECYRVCYQLRLRGQDVEESLLQDQLMQLVYLIVVELVITKNSLTLVSYLESLIRTLEDQLAVKKMQKSERYLENVTFALFIARALVILHQTKNMAAQDKQFETLATQFTSESSLALRTLSFAMNSWAPHVGGPAPTPEEKVLETDLTGSSIIAFLRSGRISTRIICCTLAVWDLDAAFDANLGGEKLEVEVPQGEDKLDKIYSYVMSQWGDHANRVFCIE